ncbi:Invertase, partial [Sarracenia purpurea var. burkii]
MHYNGIYHLFYQYNPKGAVSSNNIVWAHSVSKDLINWKPLDLAIYPTKVFDQYGCWSGSATILPGNKPVIFYTGVVDENKTQVQNYAIPADHSDLYLKEWVKPDNNPIVLPIGVNKTAFRDPTTAWRGNDGHWRMIVGSTRKNRGMAYLYRSRDFMNWTKAQHPLHSVAMTGNWECPDFYPVSTDSKNGLDTSVGEGNIKHILKVSLDVTRYDYGNYYASKTFFDPIQNRRILWGWANESDTTQDDIKKGWAGIQ